MKSTLKIEIFHTRRGSSVLHEYVFMAPGVTDLFNTLVNTLKEFSANRGKRKLTLSLTCEKGK